MIAFLGGFQDSTSSRPSVNLLRFNVRLLHWRTDQLQSADSSGKQVNGFPTEDKMGLHLVNLIKDRMGEINLPYVHYHFEDQDRKRTFLVRCEKGPKPAYVKDGGQ